MYVIRNKQNETIVIRRNFACTQEELPRELAFAAHIKPIDLTFYTSIHGDQAHMTDAQLSAIYSGTPWPDEPLSSVGVPRAVAPIETAQRGEQCAGCGYPFDTGARVIARDGLVYCGRGCLKS